MVSDLSFVDEDALLKDGVTYYYLVRKYQDDVILNIKSSSVLSDDSISIGVVTTSDGVGNVDIDLLSNGMKMRDSGNNHNSSGHTYIYLAFAEAPFKFANAR